MELRGEVDQEMGTPSTLCFDSSNKESSTRLPNSSLLTSQTTRNQTSVQLHFAHHHNQNHQNSNPNPNPDPIPSIPQPIANSRSISRTSITAQNINSPPVDRYRECLKNHAASSGGHVLDGCGEFMPGGEDGTPEALKCAACECHRNFHRREMRTAPPPLSRHHRFPAVPISSMMMAFGASNGAPAESSSEDLNTYHQSNSGALQPAQVMKKRFRTKFTQGQKEKMVEFAEKLGWKIQKHDEVEVQRFCAEVGVKKQVFKVWMHNNKQAMKKKQL